MIDEEGRAIPWLPDKGEYVDGSIRCMDDDSLLDDVDCHYRLDEIYNEHFDFVWRSLLRLGIDPGDCEDQAHEVFIVVHRRIDSYRGERGELRGWIYGIVRRTASNGRRSAMRRRRLKQRVQSAQANSSLVPCATAAVASPESREWVSRVEGLVDRLDPGLREAFILFDIEEMTGPEVSCALGITPASAFRRRRAAREQLRKWLERGASERQLQQAAAGWQELRRANHRVRASSSSRKRVWALIAPITALSTSQAAASAGGVAAMMAVVKPVVISASVFTGLVAAEPVLDTIGEHIRDHVGTHAPRTQNIVTQQPGTQPRKPTNHPALALAVTEDEPPQAIEPSKPAALNSVGPREVSAKPSKSPPAPGAARSVRAPKPSVAEAKPSASAAVRAQPSRWDGAPETLAREVRLIKSARRSLLRRASTEALETLEVHARSFPSGLFAEEALLLQLRATCELGRHEDARRLRQRFESNYPDSPLMGRVRNACSI